MNSFEGNYYLYGLKTSSLESITKIISQERALKECTRFVSDYEIVQVGNKVDVFDRIISAKNPTVGCIALSTHINSNDPRVKILSNNINIKCLKMVIVK
jgi:prephenate dehydratase